MAGSLIKIDEEIVTSAVASVTLTGINSTYDVYMLKVANAKPSVDLKNLRLRVTTSGTPDTSSNYDWAAKGLNTGTFFFNNAHTNQDKWYLGQGGTGTSELINFIVYLFNFNNASEYSFCTLEGSYLSHAPELQGIQGGGVHTVAQACDGVNIFFDVTCDIQAGAIFTLYGLKK